MTAETKEIEGRGVDGALSELETMLRTNSALADSMGGLVQLNCTLGSGVARELARTIRIGRTRTSRPARRMVPQAALPVIFGAGVLFGVALAALGFAWLSVL